MHRDRRPGDGGRASLSRGDLQDRLLDSEGTTIQERCRYPGAFQIERLLLSNQCRIESLELVGGPGSRTRKSPFVSDGPKAVHQAKDKTAP